MDTISQQLAKQHIDAVNEWHAACERLVNARRELQEAGTALTRTENVMRLSEQKYNGLFKNN